MLKPHLRHLAIVPPALISASSGCAPITTMLMANLLIPPKTAGQRNVSLIELLSFSTRFDVSKFAAGSISMGSVSGNQKISARA